MFLQFCLTRLPAYHYYTTFDSLHIPYSLLPFFSFKKKQKALLLRVVFNISFSLCFCLELLPLLPLILFPIIHKIPTSSCFQIFNQMLLPQKCFSSSFSLGLDVLPRHSHNPSPISPPIVIILLYHMPHGRNSDSDFPEFQIKFESTHVSL